MIEPDIDPKLLKPYDPKETEDRIYKLWEENGFFNPDVCIEKGITDKDAEVFSMVLPPPNVTGTLHIGHASMLTIEDIMVRFARMQGKRTLWLPGTDHAAIATQAKVEKILEKEEGKRKTDLGREEFLKRVEKFAQESHDTIVNQSKKDGGIFRLVSRSLHSRCQEKLCCSYCFQENVRRWTHISWSSYSELGS